MPKGAKTKSNPKRLAAKNRFSSGVFVAFIVTFAAAGGYALWRGFAAPAAPSVYLTPSSQVVGPSGTMSIQVRENSGSTTVNAIQANFSYPSSQFTCSASTASYNTTTKTAGDISLVSSPFTTVAQVSCGSGQVNIGLGTAAGNGAVSGDQLVATITFHSTTTGGSGSMAFTTGTKLASSTTNTDILGSLSNTAGGTYTVDTSPPSVSISSPSNNAVLPGGSTVNISVSASDAQSSVAKVVVYIDGSAAGTLTSSPFTYPWNTSGASLAGHTIYAKAYDTFNNVATSSTVNVTLSDQTAPTTPGSFKATGSTINSISLSWTASSDNVGVTSYILKRGGTQIASITPPTVIYTDTGLAANTNYSYTVQAKDAAGNTSSAASLNTSTKSLTPGDLNGDGAVDVTDLSILLSDFQTTDAQADINGDGIVDVLDLSTLLSNFGT